MAKSLKIDTKDPSQLEEGVKTVTGGGAVQALKAGLFEAKAKIYTFENTRLFLLSSDPIRAVSPPPHTICGLTIPLKDGFITNDRGQRNTFSGSTAHLLNPYEPFDFSAPSGCHVMVANFTSETIANYAVKINGGDLCTGPQTNFSLSLLNPAGYHLFRTLARTYSETHSGTIYKSDIALKEMEDNLGTAFILASQEVKSNVQATPLQLRRAEEYIAANLCTPVTRAELADHAGASIRTLSRGFIKRHNMGPMTFLKQRRLDGVYGVLLNPDVRTTSVTAVALRYGFTHLGNFAGDYKKAFGESPSDTLRKSVLQ